MIRQTVDTISLSPTPKLLCMEMGKEESRIKQESSHGCNNQLGERCESFTFRSCSDFTSFSDHPNEHDTDDDDDSDHSYIEIQLSSSSSSLQQLSKLGAAAAGMPDHSSSVTLSAGQKQRPVKFLQRWLTTIISSLKLSSDIINRSSGLHNSNRKALETTRRSPLKMKEDSRVMKLLFKFRVMHIHTFLAALLKKNNKQAPRKNTETTEDDTIRIIGGTLQFHHHHYRSAKPASSRKQRMMSKSCPSSIKSSPTNPTASSSSRNQNHAREMSVQAAIAHCKKSFGPTTALHVHDFSFRSPSSPL